MWVGLRMAKNRGEREKVGNLGGDLERERRENGEVTGEDPDEGNDEERDAEVDADDGGLGKDEGNVSVELQVCGGVRMRV